MKQTIEKEFEMAMQWFNAIAAAVGSKKDAIIRDCKEQCPQAWTLLLIYLNPFSVFHVREKSFDNDIEPDGTPYASVSDMTSD